MASNRRFIPDIANIGWYNLTPDKPTEPPLMFECPITLVQCFTLASEVAQTQAATTQAAEVIPLFSLHNLLALLTLTLLEVALGIDNIVVIAILCGRLPEHQ